jgi:Zn-dependent protease
MYRTLRLPLGEVEIRATLAWLIVAVLLLGVSISVSTSAYLSNRELGSQIAMLAIVIVGVGASLALHEAAHILLARRMGGRVEALSPQLAGALPDTIYEADNPASEVKVAIAGPLASSALGGLLGALWWLLGTMGNGALADAVGLVCLANLGLAALSLMPGYPFDGGRVARGFFWYLTDDLMTATKIVGYMGYFIIMGVMTIGVLLVVSGGTLSVWGVWVLMTAFMVNRSVGAGISHIYWSVNSRRLRVDDLFVGGTRRIQSTILIDDAIERLLEGYQDGPMLVFDGEEAAGLVDLSAIRPVPRRLWTERTVGDVMRPIEGLESTVSSASLSTLVELLPPDAARIALITRDGKVIGATDRRDVVRRLQEYLAAERLEKLRRRVR